MPGPGERAQAIVIVPSRLLAFREVVMRMVLWVMLVHGLAFGESALMFGRPLVLAGGEVAARTVFGVMLVAGLALGEGVLVLVVVRFTHVVTSFHS